MCLRIILSWKRLCFYLFLKWENFFGVWIIMFYVIIFIRTTFSKCFIYV